MDSRRLPVKKKYDPYEGFPKIMWDRITKGETIGRGSFGKVVKAKYKKR